MSSEFQAGWSAGLRLWIGCGRGGAGAARCRGRLTSPCREHPFLLLQFEANFLGSLPVVGEDADGCGGQETV